VLQRKYVINKVLISKWSLYYSRPALLVLYYNFRLYDLLILLFWIILVHHLPIVAFLLLALAEVTFSLLKTWLKKWEKKEKNIKIFHGFESKGMDPNPSPHSHSPSHIEIHCFFTTGANILTFFLNIPILCKSIPRAFQKLSKSQCTLMNA